ncbi:hypothetical protein ACFSR7_36170 [Cohnella sp. GCM10020058]|uniref:hypothetical protein n=1 Tax=Cohnella sp. GCM10020058 TaxID=3317330 RepID=UPI00364354BD
MRKGFIVGTLFGAALMLGVQAGAASLTGSKVAGTKDVTLNGKTVGQAAIINNSSYLPVRAMSDSLGLGIDLSGGKINLTEPSKEVNKPVTETDPADTVESLTSQINLTKSRIVFLENWLSQKQGIATESEIIQTKASLQDFRDQLAIMELKLQKLQNR